MAFLAREPLAQSTTARVSPLQSSCSSDHRSFHSLLGPPTALLPGPLCCDVCSWRDVRYTLCRACQCTHVRVSAGEWHRLPVAVKTVVFQGGSENAHASLVASEAAIATNMKHKNVVGTYSHDLRNISQPASVGVEQSVFKFYLLQVRSDVPALLVADGGPC
jgi:hypothetical protein